MIYQDLKVTFKRKAGGLRAKSHMILIETKIEARYLKKNSQTTEEKVQENLNRANKYVWPITSYFSVERDFNFQLIPQIYVKCPFDCRITRL